MVLEESRSAAIFVKFSQTLIIKEFSLVVRAINKEWSALACKKMTSHALITLIPHLILTFNTHPGASVSEITGLI